MGNLNLNLSIMFMNCIFKTTSDSPNEVTDTEKWQQQ